MKKHYKSLALLAGMSVVCSSCVVPAGGYATYTSPGGSFSAGVSWTNANYDASGFPIFGYSEGRPVYGYTAAGAAVFSIAALTALCFVPHWSPASWYKGSYHYPSGIHRVAAPPRYPSGHRPNVRPPANAHVQPPKVQPRPVQQPHVQARPVHQPKVQARPVHQPKVQQPHVQARPVHQPKVQQPHVQARPQQQPKAQQPQAPRMGSHLAANSPKTLPMPSGARAVAPVPSNGGRVASHGAGANRGGGHGGGRR